MRSIRLPELGALREAPERAHLAMLRTATLLSRRALELVYPHLEDTWPPEAIIPFPPMTVASLLHARLEELLGLLDWYETAIDHDSDEKPLSTNQEDCF